MPLLVAYSRPVKKRHPSTRVALRLKVCIGSALVRDRWPDRQKRYTKRESNPPRVLDSVKTDWKALMLPIHH